MPIIISETQYLGKNLIFLKSIPSTNSYAKELIAKSKPKNGTVILADEQTEGRGQADNVWKVEGGQNLTFSIILETDWLAANEQFLLNMAVSLAVLKSVKQFLPDTENINIKWPNDILVNDKKICGILIENTIYGNFLQKSIIGIGLNVNQIDFDNLTKATSLKLILGQQYEKELILKNILLNLEYFIQLMKNKNELKKNYLEHLFWLNQENNFEFNGEIVKGTIRNINEIGQLMIEIENKIFIVNMKEIKFLY